MVEPVSCVLCSGEGFKGAHVDVINESVGRTNVFDDELVVFGLLIYQPLGELTAANCATRASCRHKMCVVCFGTQFERVDLALWGKLLLLRHPYGTVVDANGDCGSGAVSRRLS